jgi:hypothetical protein
LPNREEIIDRVENLNYTAYLNYDKYNWNPYEDRHITCYVDRDLIHLLKSRIKDDNRPRLRMLWPFDYEHTLRYSFLAENHSRLYLTYNNNTIFSLKDQNNQSLFVGEDYKWVGFFEGLAWYLNFTQIPYVYGNNSTVVLSDCIFVRINLEYEWICGFVCYHEHSYAQYLVLNEKLDVVVIFVYYDVFID